MPPRAVRAALEQYLDALAGFATFPSAQRHGQLVRLLRSQGQWYRTGPQTYAGKRMAMHKCYANAGLRTLDHKARYAEGYVIVHGVALEHAWNLDAEGRVIDPTLEGRETDKQCHYYGIEFTGEYLLRHCLNTGHWGLLISPNVIQVLNDFEGAQ